MDHVGPLARSVDDAALLFRVLAGPEAGRSSDSTPTKAEALRMGVPDRYFLDHADDETRRVFEAGLDALRARGVRVEPVTLPPGFEAGVDAGIVTMYAEMAAVHRERFARARERYPWRLACLLDAGERVTASQYLHAQRVRRHEAHALSALLEDFDCLVTPSTPRAAPSGLSNTGDWTCNLPFSSSGHPALSVPMGLSSTGLPMGMQFVGRYGGEERLFSCGRMLERAVSLPPTPLGIA
jgi:Asp-tRNA(Asn)/Glu-tRNA(Gln) amidotransferase A subunit family amidase